MATPTKDSEKRNGAAKGLSDMVKIRAGCFWMGSQASWAYKDERPLHSVCLSGFYIDRYEVSVEKYAECIHAGKCSWPRMYRSSGYSRFCNYGAPGRKSHPMNCVDWHQADAYCRHAGGRLPTEAEWERAARGWDRRRYPWGNLRPSCLRAIMDFTGDGCGKDRTWPVGSVPAGKSPFGVMDMAGNVGEWVEDCYRSDAYALRGKGCRNPVHRCKGPSPRVYRGGTWVSNALALRVTLRRHTNPSVRVGNLGFRCARSLAR